MWVIQPSLPCFPQETTRFLEVVIRESASGEGLVGGFELINQQHLPQPHWSCQGSEDLKISIQFSNTTLKQIILVPLFLWSQILLPLKSLFLKLYRKGPSLLLLCAPSMHTQHHVGCHFPICTTDGSRRRVFIVESLSRNCLGEA